MVHNGKVCGKIIYDAKNRNAWQNEFVVKLRADKIAQAADHAILSSNKFPKDKAQVHYQDGVIVAAPARVVAIVQLLRDQVVRMHELRISKEGREQKSMRSTPSSPPSTAASCSTRSRRRPAGCSSSTPRSRRRTAACGISARS